MTTHGCQFDGEYKTKLDLAKLTHPKVADLMSLEVLLLDEMSMLDKLCFEGIQEVLSIVDHNRRPDAPVAVDTFGEISLLLFGDFKQLPPASSQASVSAYLKTHRRVPRGSHLFRIGPGAESVSARCAPVCLHFGPGSFHNHPSRG